MRSATSADAELLAEIHRECFPNYWNSESFTNFFAVDGTCAMIAGSAEPAGMVVWRAQYEEAEIITLAVRPAWRRQGIARELMEYVIVRAKERGASWMVLDVEEGNAAAIQLYEFFGFSFLRRRRQYYRQKDGTYTDALVLRAKLD